MTGLPKCHDGMNRHGAIRTKTGLIPPPFFFFLGVGSEAGLLTFCSLLLVTLGPSLAPPRH